MGVHDGKANENVTWKSRLQQSWPFHDHFLPGFPEQYRMLQTTCWIINKFIKMKDRLLLTYAIKTHVVVRAARIPYLRYRRIRLIKQQFG